MFTQGENDAKAYSMAPSSVEDTLHYFALVRSNEQEMKGIDYDTFVAKKAAGEYGDFQEVLDSEEMQNLFLQ